MVSEGWIRHLQGLVATRDLWFYLHEQFQPWGDFQRSRTGLHRNTFFFSYFRFRLIKQRVLFLLVSMLTCLTWWQTPAGGRGRAVAQPGGWRWTQVGSLSHLSRGADTRLLIYTGGVSFLVVNMKFINVTQWWGKAGRESLCPWRICLWDFSKEEYEAVCVTGLCSGWDVSS